jgi:hypothetical protein
MDPERDAPDDVVFRGMPQSRSGDLIQDTSRPMMLSEFYERKSGAPKPHGSERRFLTGAYP